MLPEKLSTSLVWHLPACRITRRATFINNYTQRDFSKANPHGRARLKVKKTRTELQFSFGEKHNCRPYGMQMEPDWNWNWSSSGSSFKTCKVSFTKHGLDKGTRQIWSENHFKSGFGGKTKFETRSGNRINQIRSNYSFSFSFSLALP